MTLGVVWGADKIGLAPEYPFQTNSEASNLKKDNLWLLQNMGGS